jgi:hypothetical protein
MLIADRQVDFDDDDEDEEIEQAPIPRQVEEVKESLIEILLLADNK